MISLNLQNVLRGLSPRPRPDVDDRIVNCELVEEQFRQAFSDLGVLLDQHHRPRLIIPTELLFQAVDTLLPAERMGVIAGRIHDRVFLSTMYDVTGEASRTHVRADPRKLQHALMTFEKAGVELVGWVHSHPGIGAISTSPSPTDRQQYADWTRDFGDMLVGIIVVADGSVRLWGDAVERHVVAADVVGSGIRQQGGNRHVYKLVR